MPDKLEQEWAGFLARARTLESWRGLHAVQQQSSLQHLVAVWPVCCREWKHPRLLPPAHFDAAWDRLWDPAWLEHVISALCTTLQWDWERARAATLSAIHLRLVYPDGTTHQGAELYVQSLATLRELEARAGKLRGPTGGAPPSNNLN